MPVMPLSERPVVDEPDEIDIARASSLSFGPSLPPRARPGTREPVPVGPGRPAPDSRLSLPMGAEVVREFPLQLSKVERPPLRREILRRERLLDWLKVKVHNRVVLVTAEAGYGKTTLLADFARHHRRPTMWYRLDEEDRNWVSFVHYLVAAGRAIEPEFGTATKGLLAELGLGAGPSRDTIFATYLRDLQSLGSRGASLIIDDYHLVDDIADIRVLMRELISRGPERLTLVLASRQTPTLPLARLRTLGEVAELTADDLRFDLDETERLFRDTYGRALETDVLADLADRTEGWAASLEMVNAAMRDRPPSEVRAFVRNLTGAHGDLYDYLAEEVVGDLDEQTQQLPDGDLAAAVGRPRASAGGRGLAQTTLRRCIGRMRSDSASCASRGDVRRRARGVTTHWCASSSKHDFGGPTGRCGVRELHRRVARHTSSNRLAACRLPLRGGGGPCGRSGGRRFRRRPGDHGRRRVRPRRVVLLTGPIEQPNAPYELFTSRMDLHRGTCQAR